MNMYETETKLFNTHGYVPTKNEVRNIKATGLQVAARRAVAGSLKAARGKRIQTLSLKVRLLASNIGGPDSPAAEIKAEL